MIQKLFKAVLSKKSCRKPDFRTALKLTGRIVGFLRVKGLKAQPSLMRVAVSDLGSSGGSALRTLARPRALIAKPQEKKPPARKNFS